MHAVRPWSGPAYAGPQIAVAIGPNAIGESRGHIGENPAATQLPATHYLENPDVPRSIGVVGDTAVGNVQPRLVRGKAQPVGPDQIVSYHRNFTGYSIQPVDLRGQFGLCSLSLVRHQDSIARVSEPNGSVGMNNHRRLGR